MGRTRYYTPKPAPLEVAVLVRRQAEAMQREGYMVLRREGYRVLMGDLRRAKWSLVALLLLAELLAPVPNGQGGRTAAFYPIVRMLTGGLRACVFLGPPPRYTPSPEERPVKGLTCGRT